MSTCSRVHKLVVAMAGAACTLSLLSCSLPVARPIAGHPGMVRSPYTWWPRVVDVQGAIPGTVIDCPYTHHPFLVSSEYVYGYGYRSSNTVGVAAHYRDK